MAAPLLVFIEQRGGAVKKSSLEAVSEARRIATKLGLPTAPAGQAGNGGVSALLVGDNVKSLADSIAPYGADTVYVVQEPRLKMYSPEGYARAIVEVARKIGAPAIFFSASAMGKDLAPTVAAHFQTSVATDCTALAVESGALLATRPVYGGKAFITVRFRKNPTLVSLRPNVFPAETDAARKAKVEEVAVSFAEGELKSVATEVVGAAGGKADLTEASVIVAGGRGFKGPENFHLRDELAEVLGAAVGASRAVVDAGWRPHSEQVGQTGKTVSPNLYIACGISGAIQHIAGMSSSKVIVAINKDPDAPIFKIATYGIVGDLLEVLPALTEQLKKALSS